MNKDHLLNNINLDEITNDISITNNEKVIKNDTQ